MLRASTLAGLALVAATLSAGRSDPSPSTPQLPLNRAAVASVVRYEAPVPVPIRVVRPFRPPLTRYGPGHLGVDLDVISSQVVRAAGDGVVTFAGPVAGRGVVVVAHVDGVRTEYEPVRPAVRAGDRVGRGEVVGQVLGSHRGCPVAACLHWGARAGATYIDPESLLRALGPVRLLPWHA